MHCPGAVPELPIEIWAYIAEFALQASWNSKINCLGALLLTVRNLHSYLARYGLYEHIRKMSTRRFVHISTKNGVQTIRETDMIPCEGGMRHGMCMHWMAGELVKICRFELGKRHGLREKLVNGEVICSEVWDHGCLHGEVVQPDAIMWFEKGEWVDAWVMQDELVYYSADQVDGDSKFMVFNSDFRERYIDHDIVYAGTYSILKYNANEASYVDESGVYHMWITDQLIIKHDFYTIRDTILSNTVTNGKWLIRCKSGAYYANWNNDKIIIHDDKHIRTIIRRTRGEFDPARGSDIIREEIAYIGDESIHHIVCTNDWSDYYCKDNAFKYHMRGCDAFSTTLQEPVLGGRQRTIRTKGTEVRILKIGSLSPLESVSIDGMLRGTVHSWNEHRLQSVRIYKTGMCLVGVAYLDDGPYMELFYGGKLVSRTKMDRLS